MKYVFSPWSLICLGMAFGLACSSSPVAKPLVDIGATSLDVFADASDGAAPPSDVSVDAPTEDTHQDADSAVHDAKQPSDAPKADGGFAEVLVPEDSSAPDLLEDVLEVPDSLPEDTSVDATPGFFSQCFADKQDLELPGPNYDQYVFTAGSHCLGTNHQDIQGLERVVFIGDSVTVGTPNGEHLLSIDNAHFYRNLLAEWLADEFDLDRGEIFLEWGSWKAYDYGTGKGSKTNSGDFGHCAKWGGRCDDLMKQSESCFKGNSKKKKTLTIFTVGGNDVAKFTQVGGEASDEEVEAGYPKAWKVAQDAVVDLETSVKWLKDPENFPNGNYVIFGTPFEFTDGTGKVDSCTPETKLKIPGIGEIDLSELNLNVAAVAGYKEWKDPIVQRQIVVWMLEEFLRIATTYQADMIWMAESFCGHGYVASGPNPDPSNACYEGPNAALWFDETCTHPSPAGHAALYDMFRAVIEE